MPITGPMSNLASSTELLKTGTFWYRLNFQEETTALVANG